MHWMSTRYVPGMYLVNIRCVLGDRQRAVKKCCTRCALGVYCKEISENMTLY